mgnify:FL=1
MAFPTYQISLSRETKPVAEKSRRKLDKRYKNLQEMIEAGWSQQELEALIQAPRTKEATNGNMPFVDGFPICGTSLMNKEEHSCYIQYKKGLKSGASSAQKATPEQQALWAKLAAACKDNPEALSLVAQLMPQAKGPVTQLFGEEPLEPCSLHWLMYRHADGTRFENRLGTLAQFAEEDEGTECIFTKKQVEDLLKKCGEKYASFVK